MPVPILVVEVPAQDRGAKETSALIEACTAGLRGGRCELTQNRNLESGSAVAIVSWRNGERLGALLEVGEQREQGAVWRSQELDFKPEDQRLERFRALGFAIAALFRGTGLGAPKSRAVATKNAAPATPRSSVATPQKKKQDPVSLVAEDPAESDSDSNLEPSIHLPRRIARLWISAGPNGTYDPELTAWRYGFQLQVAAGLARFPAFLSAFGGYATGGGAAGVSLSWSTLGLGLGLREPLGPSFEVRGGVRGLLVAVGGQISEGERTSQQSVWVPGAGLGFEFEMHESGALGLILAGEVQTLAGNVPIRKHNQTVADLGKNALGISLSLEVRLFQEPAP
jgi:hypothetical protein